MTKYEKGHNLLLEVLYVARTIVICSVVVFMFTKIFLTPIFVDGASMFPTLKDKDFGLTSVLAKNIGKIERFDVVVVNHDQSDVPWVKRVIGLPGETIKYRDDELYINNEIVKEDYLDEDYINEQTINGTLNFTTDFGPVKLGHDEYFLLGDNRLVSQDSRSVGPFNKEDFMSKYVYVLYPFKNMNFVRNTN